MTGRLRRALAGISVWLVVLTIAGPVDAAVGVENRMRTESALGGPGFEIYEYGSGPEHVADFATGTHSGTADNGGTLELTATDDWWDRAWDFRQCFTVSSPTGMAEYPLRFVVDTSGTSSTGADVRVTVGPDGPLLASYSEGPFPGSESVVWAQAEPLPSGSSDYCVYFGNPAATTVSDEVATFTYTTGQTISHYTMLDTYDNWLLGVINLGRDLTVVSYADDNVVTHGLASVTLDAGDLYTFTGVTSDSVITSTGPIDGSFDRNGNEGLLPEGYADSVFSFPTSRYNERFWIRSPHATTTVEAVSNGAVIASVTVGPASGSVELIASVGGAGYATLRSTDGTDFLAMHATTDDRDVFPGVPWFGDTLYGVASTRLNFGALAPTTVSWVRHNGASNPSQSIAINTTSMVTGNGNYGNGRAYAVTGNSRFAAAQQADGDGTDTTSFLPSRLLSQTYRLPVAARYYTIACPIPGTLVSINGGAGSPCNGTGVGLRYSGRTNHPAGTLIEADHPVFVYYETFSAHDEHNLSGVKSNIPYLDGLAITPGAVEPRPDLCGTWTSATLPVSGAFGTASFTATTPPATSAGFQISTDGSAFYGPDGTAATSFAEGDVIPYVADFTSTLALRIELCAPDLITAPTVTDALIEYDLSELAPTVSTPAPVARPSGAAATEPILRVYQRAPGTWQGRVEYRDGTNLAVTDATFTTDHPTTQVDVTGGTVTQHTAPFSHSTTTPYTLSATHATAAGQTSEMELNLVDELGVQLESAVRITFTG